jgi:hypothetical protein
MSLTFAPFLLGPFIVGLVLGAFLYWPVETAILIFWAFLGVAALALVASFGLVVWTIYGLLNWLVGRR